MWYHKFYFATRKDAERASRSTYFECRGRQVYPLNGERALLQVITPSQYGQDMGETIAFQIGAEAHVINIAEDTLPDRQLSTLKHLLTQASTLAMNMSPLSPGRETHEVWHQYKVLTEELQRMGMAGWR